MNRQQALSLAVLLMELKFKKRLVTRAVNLVPPAHDSDSWGVEHILVGGAVFVWAPTLGKMERGDPKLRWVRPVFPSKGHRTTAEYVEEFCRLNHLVHCRPPDPTNGS